ncbi:MAG: AAA family ATPase [Pseudonocardiaceae bacterium]
MKSTSAVCVTTADRNHPCLSHQHATPSPPDHLAETGCTAPKTKEVLKRAMGGVLFIDEAYYLYRSDNERDYEQESIEILLQVMENHREDLVVILASYKDRMDSFFASNPGMSSRIAHRGLHPHSGGPADFP